MARFRTPDSGVSLIVPTDGGPVRSFEDSSIPIPFRQILEARMQRDRELLAGLPLGTGCIRQYECGEFWPQDAAVDLALLDALGLRGRLAVAVWAIDEGARAREPLFDMSAIVDCAQHGKGGLA